MRKIFAIMLIICLIVPSVAFASPTPYSVSSLDNGMIVITVEKQGNYTAIIYDSKGYIQTQKFSKTNAVVVPITNGDGEYVLHLYRRIGDTDVLVFRKSVVVSGEYDFLQNTTDVNWEKDGAVAKLSKVLLPSNASAQKKVELAYKYIELNFWFDQDMTPMEFRRCYTDEFVSINGGHQIDFASTFAAILRSAGVPTKIVRGLISETGTPHIWNEVLIDGTWYVVDTFSDHLDRQIKKDVPIFKIDAQSYIPITIG